MAFLTRGGPLVSAMLAAVGLARSADACESDAACKGDRVCVDGTCQAPAAPAAAACLADVDCGGDQICDAGACRSPCTKDVECPGEAVCQAGACRATVGCTKDSECPGDSICTAAACVAPAVVEPPPAPASSPPPTEAPASPSAAASAHPPSLEPPTAILVAPAADDAMDDEERRGSALKLMFSGVGLFAATWLFTIPITAAASDGSITGDATPLSAIPFAGPFLIMDNHELTTEGDVVYGIVGGLQLAAPVIVFFGSLGLMDSDEPQPVQLVANGHGLALGGSF